MDRAQAPPTIVIRRTASGPFGQQERRLGSRALLLYPITAQHAQWEAESWAIWRRFTNHPQGKNAPALEIPSDWGALPEDLSRHRALREELARIRAIDRVACVTATGSFRRIDASPSGFVAPMLEVEKKEFAAEPR
jgi:hypothetical protein